MSKRIVGITMVKNEEDVIESSLRHNLNIADMVVVYDHYSSDATVAIIQKMIAEGLPVVLKKADNSDHNQTQVMTRLMHEAFDTHKADVVFPFDGDEFLICVDHKSNPRELIESFEDDVEYWVNWRTYFPSAEDDASQINPSKRLVEYSDEARQGCQKVIVTRSVYEKTQRAPLAHGQHQLLISRRLRKNLRRQAFPELRMAHYPMRSVGQLVSKVVNGWMNNCSRPDWGHTEVVHWKSLVEKMRKKNEQLTLRDIRSFIAYSYMDEVDPERLTMVREAIGAPFVGDIELKYSTGEEVFFMRNFIENTEALAKKHAQLQRDCMSVTKIFPMLGRSLVRRLQGFFLGYLGGISRYRDLYRY